MGRAVNFPARAGGPISLYSRCVVLGTYWTKPIPRDINIKQEIRIHLLKISPTPMFIYASTSIDCLFDLNHKNFSLLCHANFLDKRIVIKNILVFIGIIVLFVYRQIVQHSILLKKVIYSFL